MHTNGLNSLEYAQKLKAAGVPPDQAEAQASVLYEIVNSNLVNKQDLANTELKIENVKADLKRDIKELDLKIENTKTELKKDIEITRTDLKRDMMEIKKDIKELETKFTMRMIIASGSFATAILVILVALVKLGLLTPMKGA